MTKRILALLLALLMVAPLAACGDTAEQPQDTTPDSTASDTEPVETDPPVTWAENQKHDITEKLNFDGRAIGIINQNNAGEDNSSVAGSSMLGSNETNATVLQLRTYERDAYLMEQLNITFKETSFYYENLTAGTQQLLMSGDLTWDIAHWNTFRTFKGVLAGLMYDIETLPYVDQTKAYWATGVQEDLSINGKQFLVINDFTTGRYSACECIAFNMSVLERHSLESPYDLVDNNQWTFDKMIEMATKCVDDVDGNGEYEGAIDNFGFSLNSQSILYKVYNAAGGKVITHDENGTPVFTAGSDEKLQLIWDWCRQNLDENEAILYSDLNDDQDGFMADRILFELTSFGGISAYRSMESDFGVVPFPKWEASQDRYYNYGGGSVTALAVLFSTEVPNAVGALLEMGAAYGHQNLVPMFYDNDLKLKLARDPKAGEMYDLILNSAVYDMGRLGFWSETAPVCDDGYNNGGVLASLVKRWEKKISRTIEGEIDKMFEAIKDRT